MSHERPKMKKKIKQLIQIYSKSKVELNDDDKAIIPVHLSCLEAALSDYGTIEKPVINSEFASFLEQHILATHLLHDIQIEVESEQMTEKDIEFVQQAIQNYYREDATIEARKLKRGILATIYFLIVAVVVFSIMIVLNQFHVLSTIGLELFDIAGWVFTWEAVDQFFIERPIRKFELLKSHKLIEATVHLKQANQALQ
ncbi:MAG: hypothetical protein NC182_07290 [Prevotella sp.]|nr:hypothetical protein [Staphylococcus sp.]MCM1350986.1 hypothetical protein [Prevotella sp.]